MEAFEHLNKSRFGCEIGRDDKRRSKTARDIRTERDV